MTDYLPVAASNGGQDEVEVTICHMGGNGPAYPSLDELISQLVEARGEFGGDAMLALVGGPSALDRTYLVISSRTPLARESETTYHPLCQRT